LKKADEIVDRTGIDKRDAIRVALGKTTVQDVLKRMMVEEKAAKLVRRHGLPRSVAFNVVRGQVSLDQAVLLKELKESESWQPERSILIERHESKEPAVFYAFGREPFVADVTKLTKYDCWLARPDEEPEELQKHELILACDPAVQPELEERKTTDERVAAMELGPSERYTDRFRSSKRVLFRHHKEKTPIRVVFRNGMVIEGHVGWFGKWEFSLAVSPTCEVVVFRHAMHSLEPIAGEAFGSARSGVNPEGEQKKKANPGGKTGGATRGSKKNKKKKKKKKKKSR
jgi:sRNA-binding regulator protein Hfq